MIIFGQPIANNMYAQLAGEIKQLKIKPKLALIFDEKDPGSNIYVRSLKKISKKLNIDLNINTYKGKEDWKNIIYFIEHKNKDSKVHGILVMFSPGFHTLYKRLISLKIDPNKDIEGISPFNRLDLELFKEKTNIIIPPTVQSCIKLIESVTNLRSKYAVIIGKSYTTGLPLAQMLLNSGATVTICHSQTKDLSSITKKADIIISAIGKPKFITEDMVGEGAIVIDVGINKTKQGIVGDVDFECVVKKARAITPVPGGVGALTPAFLIKNLLIAIQKQTKH